jgi:hypothetical protein
MDEKNLALSAEEQINLKVSNLNENEVILNDP